MKKISIILPVYNGSSYLERAIRSVLGQEGINLQDIELIILDDGSSDNSLQIAKSFAKKYSKLIKVHSHKNIGVANTRNKGIDLARGKYILFIDQDDYFDLDYCKTLYNAAEDGNWDVVICGKKRPDNRGKIIGKDIYINAEFTRYMSVSVWAKIHNTKFLKDNGIRIFNNHQGEDIVFSFEEAQKTKKVKTLQYCGYNWFYNRESVSNSSQRGLDKNNLRSILNVQDALIRLDTSKDNMSTYFITLMSAYYLFFAGRASTPNQFLEAYKVLFDNLKTFYPNYHKNPYIMRAPEGTLPLFSTGVKVFMLLHKLRLIGPFARVYCRRKRDND